MDFHLLGPVVGLSLSLVMGIRQLVHGDFERWLPMWVLLFFASLIALGGYFIGMAIHGGLPTFWLM